jgi:hypothetical protein
MERRNSGRSSESADEQMMIVVVLCGYSFKEGYLRLWMTAVIQTTKRKIR